MPPIASHSTSRVPLISRAPTRRAVRARYRDRVIRRGRRLWILLRALALAALIGTTLTACAADASGSATPASETDSLSLLFQLEAEAGTLTQLDGATYALELTTAGERMIWFSDRPDRKAGSLRTDEFIAIWPDFGFDEDPPNIGFTANGISDGVSVVATMTEPAYDAATAVFTAELEILFAAPNSGLEDGTDTPYSSKELPETLTEVSVFIDDATCSVMPGGTPHCSSMLFEPFDSSF